MAQFFLARVEGVDCAYGSAVVGPFAMGIVEDLFTLPGYRKRGLATAIVAHAIAHARALGMGPMLIGTVGGLTQGALRVPGLRAAVPDAAIPARLAPVVLEAVQFLVDLGSANVRSSRSSLRDYTGVNLPRAGESMSAGRTCDRAPSPIHGLRLYEPAPIHRG